MNWTTLVIDFILWTYRLFNRDVFFVFEIHPTFNTFCPNDIIIDLWLITHTNADSSGVCFGIIAEYGVVSFISTDFPMVLELTGE
jgi:hypothetical protein